MFLIRLIHLQDIKKDNNTKKESTTKARENIDPSSNYQKKEEDLFEIKDKAETIGQMKNVVQEKDIKLKEEKEMKIEVNSINSFDDLIKICSSKKEIKLKYELEKNVNLVNFENQRIEISFNDDLDKDFIKDLSTKLNEWTNSRWIITLSKTKGQPSKKENEVNLKKEQIEIVKNSRMYQNILEKFSDAELIDIKDIEEKIKND
jgi:DNA polymerase-3 subunit gamma/tau